MVSEEEKRSASKEKIITNFRKAHSLLQRVEKMVREDRYCIEIMQQNLAVMGLLRSAHEMLMRRHLETCFKDAFQSQDQKRQQEMIEEILKVTRLFNR